MVYLGTMNSEVGRWDADFMYYCSLSEFLKSLPTFVEIGNWDVDFNSGKLKNSFAEFIKKYFLSEVSNACQF